MFLSMQCVYFKCNLKVFMNSKFHNWAKPMAQNGGHNFILQMYKRDYKMQEKYKFYSHFDQIAWIVR